MFYLITSLQNDSFNCITLYPTLAGYNGNNYLNPKRITEVRFLEILIWGGHYPLCLVNLKGINLPSNWVEEYS